jgi:holo-[acyl-carrier protein] synthase
MILGVGTDIIEVDRVKKAVGKPEFKNKVFTEREIEYCDKNNSAESYAARGAAKEAFFKALGTGWVGEMKITEVEVLNNSEGKPEIVLSGNVLKVFKEKGGGNIHLSLSHVKETAVAFVIIEKAIN